MGEGYRTEAGGLHVRLSCARCIHEDAILVPCAALDSNILVERVQILEIFARHVNIVLRPQISRHCGVAKVIGTRWDDRNTNRFYCLADANNSRRNIEPTLLE